MEILTILVATILPLLIGFILGENRDNNKIIFNKKLEIYSDIVYHLNSAKYLRLNLNISMKNLGSIAQEIVCHQEETTEDSLDEKFKCLDKRIDRLNYEDELVKLFAPARLIGGNKVVGELRECFSLISEYHQKEAKKDLDDLGKKINKSVMELEQLMRKDLGYSRNLSKLDIWWHLRKD